MFENIAVMANSLLSMSLATKEGHFTHIEITNMYIEIYNKLKSELFSDSNTSNEE